MRCRLVYWLDVLFGCRFDRPLFIVGCGRSGTTLMGQVLSQHPAVCYLEEPRRMWLGSFPATYVWNFAGFPEPQGRARLDASDVTPWAARLLRARFHNELVMDRKSRLVEKTPLNALRMPFIDRLFPGCLFLNMVRHPVAVAESIEQRCLEGDWFVRSPAYWKAQAAAAIHAGIPADLVASCETYMEKALLQWRLHMETCRHDTALLGCERVLDVRYEDFVSSPRDDLARILDFAQLHTAPELDTFCLERIKPRRMKTRRTLGQRERTIAGPLLDEFLEGADGIT